MKAATLLLAGMVLATAFLAAAPAAEAQVACVFDGRTDPCDEWLVCVWNPLEGRWECAVYFGCVPHCRLLP